MRIASFFSGIGGAERALPGAHPVIMVERDPHCRRVLKARFPGVPIAPDIHGLAPGDIPSAAAWAGGFPCQGTSAAGKGAGLQDARSGLWHVWARLIAACRPPAVLIENSPLLRTRGLDVVLSDLAAAGYDAHWCILAASDVDAWHWRKRMWILATLQHDGVALEAPSDLPANGSMMDGFIRSAAPVTRGKPKGPWPTMTAGDASNAGQRSLETSKAKPGVTLPDMLCRGILPTMSARDHRSGKGRQDNGHAPQLPEVMGGVLRPEWCEPFMGYPVGWTDPTCEAPLKVGLPDAWSDGTWLEAAGAPTLPPRTGGPMRRPRIRALGNAWVPQCARLAWEILNSDC